MSTPPKPFEQRWAELKGAFRKERRWSRYLEREHAKNLAEIQVLKHQVENLLRHIEAIEEKELGNGAYNEHSSEHAS